MYKKIYIETLEVKEDSGENPESNRFPVWTIYVLCVAFGIGIAVETALVILLGRVLMEMRELSVLLQYFR